MTVKLFPQVDARVFLILVSGSIVLVVAVLTMYGLIPNYKNYTSLISDFTKLERIVSNADDVETNIDVLKEEIDKTKHLLKGDMANLPEKEMEAYIIGVLQNISWSNSVNLIAVKPSKGSEIHEFQEMLFIVKLSGEYHNLYKWFIQLRNELGFIVIKNMNLNPLNNVSKDSPIMMELTVSSYKSKNE